MAIRATLGSTVGVVWLVLVVATCLSWWLGADHGLGTGDGATVSVIAVAFFKVRLVGIHFMEIGRAPAQLRVPFEVYVGVVAAALVGMFLLL